MTTYDTAAVRAAMPLCATLGIEAVTATSEQVVLRLAWAAALCTAGGALHGGALMALADSAGALAAHLNLPGDASGTTTLESRTSLFAAVRGGAVTATARPVHTGRTTIAVVTELRDDRDRLVATTSQTQVVLRTG